jgi:hypothetical protein
MKASELIAKLEELKSEHGDLPVCLFDMRWEEYRANIKVDTLQPCISKRTGKVEDGLEDRTYIWIDWE